MHEGCLQPGSGMVLGWVPIWVPSPRALFSISQSLSWRKEVGREVRDDRPHCMRRCGLERKWPLFSQGLTFPRGWHRLAGPSGY